MGTRGDAIMRIWGFALAAGLAAAGCASAAAQDGAIADEEAFLARCTEDTIAAYPQTAPWAEEDCAIKWQWAANARPIADALHALAPEPGGAAPGPAAIRAAPTGVRWSSDTEGALDALGVLLTDTGQLSFYWREQATNGNYHLTDALRLAGATIETLGCPQFMGVSLGQEKVMAVTFPDRAPFTLAVYARGAPTGFEFAVFEADAGFGGTLPDWAALQAGDYPGGGGRAFGGEPIGWQEDCNDVEWY